MVQAPDVEMGHRDLPQALLLLGEMNVSVQHVAALVDGMLARVRNGEISTDQGLSFLEMKYNMLLSYLINLTFVVLRKCSGESIDGDPCIDRLVEIRAVLEKIRPINHKLKYQIDKLVKTAVHGISANDPLLLAPRPQNFVYDSTDEEDAAAGDDEDTAKKTPAVYVPPRMAPVHYPGSIQELAKRMEEQSKKFALSSAIMDELREEYLDTPVEVTHGGRAQQKMSKAAQERQQYEEEYLTRLPTGKKEKQTHGRLPTVSSIGDEITSFGASVAGSSRRKRRAKSKSRRNLRKRTH